MFIRNCLTDKSALTTVYPTDEIRTVLSKMHGHLSLPCIDSDENFVGIVSKRTIFEAFQAAYESGTTYEEFLQQSIDHCIDSSITALELTNYFEETIDVIVRYPFVPIVSKGKLLGIVKRGDVNQSLGVAFGGNVAAHRLLLGMAEVEGALFTLFSITHKLGINVITAVPFDAGENALNRRLILKVEKTDKLNALTTQLERAGFMLITVDTNK